MKRSLQAGVSVSNVSRTQVRTCLLLAALAAASACGQKDKKDKPATEGSAGGSGSAAAVVPATIDAAPPPPPDAAAPVADAAPAPDAAAPADPLTTVCPPVIAKIQECAADKDFAAALAEGADAKEKKKIKKLISEIPTLRDNLCQNFSAAYEFEGFLSHWDKLSDATILETCAKLGAAVKAAGGLFGGDEAM